jgi:hypothetical protein
MTGIVFASNYSMEVQYIMKNNRETKEKSGNLFINLLNDEKGHIWGGYYGMVAAPYIVFVLALCAIAYFLSEVSLVTIATRILFWVGTVLIAPVTMSNVVFMFSVKAIPFNAILVISAFCTGLKII